MTTTRIKPWNKNSALAAGSLAVVMGALSAQAADVAWWRFEECPANSNVARNGQGDGTFYGGTADSSGNGNALSAWSDGSYAGYAYNSQVATSVLPVNGAANNFSVKNTGGYPALFTETGTALQTWSPTAWTVEATFKLENGGYRTIVGRDSRGSVTTDVHQTYRTNSNAVTRALTAALGSREYPPLVQLLVAPVVMAPGWRQGEDYRRYFDGILEAELEIEHARFKDGDDLLRRRLLFALFFNCLEEARRALPAAAESLDRLEADLRRVGSEQDWLGES